MEWPVVHAGQGPAEWPVGSCWSGLVGHAGQGPADHSALATIADSHRADCDPLSNVPL